MFHTSPEDFKQKAGYVIDGVWYPRVTSIVSIKAKPGLANFFREVNDSERAEEIKQKSADEGTLIHEIAEAILKNKPLDTPPPIAPAIAAFRSFLLENAIQVDPDWIERRIVHYDERYAGTVDALALINGKFGLLDIKTSLAIYRDYNLQTSAYVSALKDRLPDLQTRWILRIDQTQTCRKCGASLRTKGGREKIRTNGNGANGVKQSVCEHDWSETQGVVELKEFPGYIDDYHAFLGAKKLWEWEHNWLLREIGYL